MSKYSRYLFVKKLYPNYLVFLRSKDKLETFGTDLEILNIVGLDKVFDINTNYIVLDNLDIIKIKKFPSNNYFYYFKIKLAIDVVDYIENRI